jgi:membrane protease YdiL (CAAX protease family)
VTPIESGLVKAGVAAAAIGVVLVRTRTMPRDELGLVRPRLGPAFLFLALYLGWMFGTDALIHWRGPWDLRPWIAAPLLASALRVLAVAFLGPAAEELVFRGWFYGLLKPRIGTAATIALTVLSWALLHWSYSWPVIFIIAVDGLLLGLARWQSGSVYPPVVMHMLYNLYAVW